MRCRAAWITVFVLVASATARLAAVSADAEASRCALACARAMGTAKAAVCCPMSHADAGPSLASCSREEIAAPASAGTMLLPSAVRLEPPAASRRRNATARIALRSPHSRPPDKVPLLFV